MFNKNDHENYLTMLLLKNHFDYRYLIFNINFLYYIKKDYIFLLF